MVIHRREIQTLISQNYNFTLPSKVLHLRTNDSGNENSHASTYHKTRVIKINYLFKTEIYDNVLENSITQIFLKTNHTFSANSHSALQS